MKITNLVICRQYNKVNSIKTNQTFKTKTIKTHNLHIETTNKNSQITMRIFNSIAINRILAINFLNNNLILMILVSKINHFKRI